jgi:hypothetical protein
VIDPYFTPGSGWQAPAVRAPGSIADIEGRKLAAFPCVVVQMREHSMRLPAEVLLAREHPEGFVLLTDHWTRPRWVGHLYRPPEWDRDLLPQLSEAELIRENKGVRLYRGKQWVNGMTVVQSWLCAPTAARAREVLLALDWRSGGG